MPLVAHSALPSFERLRAEGMTVLDAGRAAQQDIRELHVGLLNMMPDGALEATERQFYRLVGESNPIAQFYLHPFTLPDLPRGPAAREHIARHYESFEALREGGLDALIITGANVTHDNLADEPFWQPLIEVIGWASEHVTSTLCSCLATHAVMQFKHQQPRVRQPHKIWGVFEHRVTGKQHPLVADINTRFDVPHSRWNDVSRAQFESAGVHVLAESPAAGVHLAVSPDGLRMVFFQGHPEYDTVSLLKEYKRDLALAAAGRLPWPPFPEHYFNAPARALMAEYSSRLKAGEALEFPESLVTPWLDNTWHDTAEAVVGNWMGCVYQVTHHDRRLPFKPGVDPLNPLGLPPAD
jgi:homoserine O-succinyltransferase